MTVLVTGGAGRVGNRVVRALREAGEAVLVLDDLSAGEVAAMPGGVPLVVGDAGDRDLLARLLRRHRLEAILHLAGPADRRPLPARPLEHYRATVDVAHALLAEALRAGIGHVVIASTTAAAMPGRSDDVHGRAMAMVEAMLAEAASTGRLTGIALRLPEAATDAGGLPDASDVAAAFLAALAHLRTGGASATLDCGDALPVTAAQVAAACSGALEITRKGPAGGRPQAAVIRILRAPRRPAA